MAQSIPSMPILPRAFAGYLASCWSWGGGGGGGGGGGEGGKFVRKPLSEGEYLSIPVETVYIVPFSIFHF